MSKFDYLKSKEYWFFWEAALFSRLSKASAIKFREKIDESSECGISPQAKGIASLRDNMLEASILYPRHVVLIRQGNFYESFGVSALALVEFAGLNPMGSGEVAKAGTPLSNIQSTIDSLILAGFNVVVMEQEDDPKNPRKKTRYISAVLSNVNAIYAVGEELSIKDLEASTLNPRGIIPFNGGFHIVEFDASKGKALVSPTLSLEASTALLSSNKVSEADSKPYIFVSSHLDPYSLRSLSDLFSNYKIESISYASDAEALASFVAGVSFFFAKELGMSVSFAIEALASSSGQYLPFSSAKSLGLEAGGNVASLSESIVGKEASRASSELLKRMLYKTPSLEASLANREVISSLRAGEIETIPFSHINYKKYLFLLKSSSANTSLLLDLKKLMQKIINLSHFSKRKDAISLILQGLESVENGVNGYISDEKSFMTGVKKIHNILNHFVYDEEDVKENAYEEDKCYEALSLYNSDEKSQTNPLFKDVEGRVRKRIRKNSAPKISFVYDDINIKAKAYDEALGLAIQDTSPKVIPIYESFDEAYYFSKITPQTIKSFNPKDRHGKTLTSMYETEAMRDRLSEYKASVKNMEALILDSIKKINKAIYEEVDTIYTAILLSCYMTAMKDHSSFAIRSGWSNDIKYDNEAGITIVQAFPYFVSQSSAVKNDILISDKLILLTGANAAGKSTYMRTLASIALLASAGLSIPARKYHGRKIDTVYMRTGANDDASNRLSLFEAEMSDTSFLLSQAHRNSLICLDEIGKGTTSVEGSAIALSLIEHLSKKDIPVVFSTHFYEIFDMGLDVSNISLKQMEINEDTLEPSYKILDGRSYSSLAFYRSVKMGVPMSIIHRAKEAILFRHPNALIEDYEGKYFKNKEDKKAHSIHDIIISLLYEVRGKEGGAYSILSSRYDPPLKVIGKSILYIIDGNEWAYVGESDDFRNRVSTHRREDIKKGKDIIYIEVENKSEARRLETLLIKRLKDKKVLLLSDHDGSHTNFSKAC